jgi:2,3-dihydroxy-2,3-dihydro-p-cumate dehydrogenase
MSEVELAVHPIARTDVEDFLFAEAELLDEWRLPEWLELFTDDAIYYVPATDLAVDASPDNNLFYVADDRFRLSERVKRLMKRTAHAEFRDGYVFRQQPVSSGAGQRHVQDQGKALPSRQRRSSRPGARQHHSVKVTPGMDKKLKNNVAVVTGAARGIGLAIAERLARDGARLVVADLDEAELDKATEHLIKEFGAEVASYAGDLSSESVAKGTIDLAVDRFGRLDVLVNNAGGGIIRAFAEHTPETLRTTIDRNLWTVLWCSWHAIPKMRANSYGRIVNLGADSVRNGLWDHAAYNAAKGGVHGLTTGMAREFARDGITVNTVAPCAVNTPQMVAITKRDPALAAKFVSVIPMGRPAEMEEVASMVSYLASAEASFVTGQVISVNGGSTML